MRHTKRVGGLVSLTVLVFALTTCTNPMLATLQTVVTEYQQPAATLNFATGSSLAETTPIVVSFSDSMDPASLSLGGTLADLSDGGSWSASTTENDTLTITPRVGWPVGNDRTLTIAAADTDTYAMVPVDLTYGVLDGVIYVHAGNGADTNPGTHDRPKASVQAAVEVVERVYDDAQVKIAGGTYYADEEIFVQKSLDLIGGFSPNDWTVNDPLLHETVVKVIALGTVTEASAIGFLGESAAGSSAVGLTIDVSQPQAGHGVSVVNSSVSLANLQISVAATEFASGISIDTSTVEISNCGVNMDGSITDGIGRGVTALQADVTLVDSVIEGANFFAYVGVSVDDSTLIMRRCRVMNGLATETNFGIMTTSTTADIRNNVVYAGLVQLEQAVGTGAVLIDSSDVTLWNNTLDGGSASNGADGANTHGMIITGGGTIRVENNIILAAAGDNRFGIKQLTANATPSEFNNNLIFIDDNTWTPPNASYRYVPTETLVTDGTSQTLEGFIASLGGSASGNVLATDPALSSADYSFTGSAPVSVTGGGRDLSTAWPGEWPSATDILGVARTPPWSMGAYEY